MQQILSPTAPEPTQARQGSRLLQIETAVDRALQRLKDEHDSLPEELTEDDVGRTLLRRASPEDLPRLRKLLVENQTTSDEELSCRWWSTSSFVLILCRAVAALEDPPLGCAVLTLSFDMTKGKALRIAQIGNEPHLPQERLVECLQTFAVCMKSTLLMMDQQQTESAMMETMPVHAIRSLLTTRAAAPAPSPPAATTASSSACLRASCWPLQSVLEEEESEGASSMERRGLSTTSAAAVTTTAAAATKRGSSSKSSNKRTRRL